MRRLIKGKYNLMYRISWDETSWRDNSSYEWNEERKEWEESWKEERERAKTSTCFSYTVIDKMKNTVVNHSLGIGMVHLYPLPLVILSLRYSAILSQWLLHRVFIHLFTSSLIIHSGSIPNFTGITSSSPTDSPSPNPSEISLDPFGKWEEYCNWWIDTIFSERRSVHVPISQHRISRKLSRSILHLLLLLLINRLRLQPR